MVGWGSAAAAGQGQLNKNSDTLIDSHTHFYDPTRAQGVPWPPREHKLLYRTVLPKDYRAVLVPRPMAGTIVVEASPWLEDNQWILDLAAREPFIVGFVGNLPAGTKEFREQLKRFAANKIFRGIRLHGSKLESGSNTDALVGDLKLLAKRDLSLDLVGGAEILPAANRLAKEIPDLRIIIDHLAGVVVDGKAPPAIWLEQMQTLARRRNVFFKLSGLVEGTGRSDGSASTDAAFYRPVLDAMLKIFGSSRLIYASNWPVSEMFASLDTVQTIVQDFTRSRGRGTEEQVFSQSSKAAYRWTARKCCTGLERDGEKWCARRDSNAGPSA